MGTASRARGELEDEEERRPPPPTSAPPLVETIEDLQKRAGNRAVSSALAREPQVVDVKGPSPFGPDGSFNPYRTDAPYAPPRLTPTGQDPARRQAEVLAKVQAYVDRERETLAKRIRQRVSIAEILDAIVQAVPEAREVRLDILTEKVRAMFPGLVIATHRDGLSLAGVKSEIESQARLALPSLGGAPEITSPPGPGGYMRVGLSGVAVGVRGGPVEAEAQVGWDQKTSLTTRVGRVLFEASLTPPKGDEKVEWNVSLQFPNDEGLVPALDTLPKIFSEAEKGIRNAAGTLARQGTKGASAAATEMKPVKDAVEALSKIAALPGGPRLGVSVEGKGPEVTVKATLTISF